MKLNYSKIGDYIRLVDERNVGLKGKALLGLSISKQFIPSVANLVGTDMENYKIIRKNQFACSTMQVRRDKKMPVALLKEVDEAIISQAYPVFEVTDTKVLLPEYLMMWFTRQEFDREACFYAIGGVRGSLEWEDFCDMKLPIPKPDKQNEIVKEYKVIVNRIELSNKLIQRLEETAKTIYKQWLVDFEFPDKNGLPYKSNGGEMVESELGAIPKYWTVTNLGRILENKGYIRGPFGSALKKDDMVESGIPVYEQQHVLMEHRNFRYFINSEKFNSLKRFEVRSNDILVSCSGINLGAISAIKSTDKVGIINQALLILRVNSLRIDSICVYYFLKSEAGSRLLVQESGGSAQPNIAKREVVQAIPFILPAKHVSVKLAFFLRAIETEIDKNRKIAEKLTLLHDLLLSKLATIEN